MSEHAQGDTVDFEALLRRALAPVEPPDELAERLESTLVELTELGRRRARGLGAVGHARPAQLGAPGRRGGGRHRRGHRARDPARAPARRSATSTRACAGSPSARVRGRSGRGPQAHAPQLIRRAGPPRSTRRRHGLRTSQTDRVARGCPAVARRRGADGSSSPRARRGRSRSIYERHCGAAFSLAYRMCGTRALAEDVVQEAFLSIWRSGARYDRARGSVRTWVLGIVHNRAIDALRRVGRARTPARQRRGDRGALRGPRAHRGRGRAARGGARRSAACSTRCPTEQSRVIELAYFGGFTHSEIAEMLETPDRHGQGADAAGAGEDARAARARRGRCHDERDERPRALRRRRRARGCSARWTTTSAQAFERHLAACAALPRGGRGAASRGRRAAAGRAAGGPAARAARPDHARRRVRGRAAAGGGRAGRPPAARKRERAAAFAGSAACARRWWRRSRPWCSPSAWAATDRQRRLAVAASTSWPPRSASPPRRPRCTREGDEASLQLANMPAPPPGRVYQVWLMRDGARAAADARRCSRRARPGVGATSPAASRAPTSVLVTAEPARRQPAADDAAGARGQAGLTDGLATAASVADVATMARPATATPTARPASPAPLRAADLPRLHDADPRRDALPGVRGQRRKVRTAARSAPAAPSRRSSPTR